ncbi:MAG: hypothetical protein H6742_18165 [Alphaproteobacteria bacterium]|nr:hypothetical protein [Alphaproteobacteria bacterium]
MTLSTTARRELEKSLRFAQIWTGLNALAAAAAGVRVATAPGMVKPLAAGLIIGTFVLVCGAGVWRIRTLQQQLRG